MATGARAKSAPRAASARSRSDAGRASARARRQRRPRPAGGPPDRGRALRRRWIALLSVLTVAGLAYVLLFTSLLGVRSVEVLGARVLPADRIREAADIPGEHAMLRLDTDDIRERVLKLPGIATAEVSRSWPSTVEIEVSERVPVGFFNGGNGFHLIDGTGMDFKTASEPPPGLPELKVPRSSPDDPVTSSMAAVLGEIPEQLRERVTSASAKTPGSVELTLAEGQTVRWGDAKDTDRKAKVLAALLTQPGQTYDVSSPELPTVS